MAKEHFCSTYPSTKMVIFSMLHEGIPYISLKDKERNQIRQKDSSPMGIESSINHNVSLISQIVFGYWEVDTLKQQTPLKGKQTSISNIL